jgi:hypothetical protein
MQTDVTRIYTELRTLLLAYSPPYNSRIQSPSAIDLWADGSFEVMGTVRNEMFFASAIVQGDYVGFYFIPVYADVPSMQKIIPVRLRAMLQGKACFRIQEWDDQLANDIQTALRNGFAIYKARGWV